MDIGEIDSLFTEVSNSADGPLPPAGGYGEARFRNLIDAAIVKTAVSQSLTVPDCRAGRRIVVGLGTQPVRNGDSNPGTATNSVKEACADKAGTVTVIP